MMFACLVLSNYILNIQSCVVCAHAWLLQQLWWEHRCVNEVHVVCHIILCVVCAHA